MGYVSENKRKAYLLAGFIGMFFCGIGDILLSFRGEGEPYAVNGMMSMTITEVPMLYYQLSFFIGIIAMIGYFLGSRAMLSYITDRLDGKPSKLRKLFGFGSGMMSLGIFGIHSVCCMAIMGFKAAADAGLSPEQIDEHFTPVLIMPFIITTIWQTAADLMVAIAYIGLVSKKVINISKAWILCGPIVLYVIFGVIKAVLNAVCSSPLPAKMFSGGETWGLSFMFLAVLICISKSEEKA